MSRFNFYIGFSIVAAACAVVIIVQHQSELELRELNRAISEERDQLRQAVAQLQATNLAAASGVLRKDLADYKEDDRIRLRRSVAELRARLDDLNQVEMRDKDEVEKLRVLNGLDEDGKLQIRLGASRDEVLAKIHQSRAEIVLDNMETDAADLTNGERHDTAYIWATAPSAVVSDDGVVSTSRIHMEFFFVDGKLVQGLSGPRGQQQSVTNWDLTWALPDSSPSSHDNGPGR